MLTDPEWAALAAQALANMLAYGSGDCARCQRARPAPGFRAGIVAAVSSMQVDSLLLIGFLLMQLSGCIACLYTTTQR